jgi:hypothetical protein
LTISTPYSTYRKSHRVCMLRWPLPVEQTTVTPGIPAIHYESMTSVEGHAKEQRQGTVHWKRRSFAASFQHRWLRTSPERRLQAGHCVAGREPGHRNRTLRLALPSPSLEMPAALLPPPLADQRSATASGPGDDRSTVQTAGLRLDQTLHGLVTFLGRCADCSAGSEPPAARLTP